MNTYTQKEVAYQTAVKAAFAKANAIGLKGQERMKFAESLYAKELTNMQEEQAIQAKKNLDAMPSLWSECTTLHAVAIAG